MPCSRAVGLETLAASGRVVGLPDIKYLKRERKAPRSFTLWQRGKRDQGAEVIKVGPNRRVPRGLVPILRRKLEPQATAQSASTADNSTGRGASGRRVCLLKPRLKESRFLDLGSSPFNSLAGIA